jgi:hypothetical protein
MPSTRCCRSCPRCDDCPVVLAARARSQQAPGGRRESPGIALLVDEVFAGMSGRTLPEPVLRTLEALDDARRRPAVPAGIAS